MILLSFLLWKKPLENNPKAATISFLSILALAVLFMVFSVTSCACATCHLEYQCTVTFQTPHNFTQENGDIVIERAEVESLTCSGVWAGEEG